MFAPTEIQVPTAPQDIQCFLFAAFLDLVPDQVMPEFEYANALVTQILTLLVGGGCNNTDLADNQGSNEGTLVCGQPHGGNDGSGSGIPLPS